MRHILRKARELGIRTVVNPSPIPDFVPDYWGDISLLILNEVEIAHMLELAGVSFRAGDWEDQARKLRKAYGVGDIVVTLGSNTILFKVYNNPFKFCSRTLLFN